MIAEADILYINTVTPYAGQESEELGDEIIARLNPQTGNIENLEVLFFTSRLLRKRTILPSCHCRPAASGKGLRLDPEPIPKPALASLRGSTPLGRPSQGRTCQIDA